MRLSFKKFAALTAAAAAVSMCGCMDNGKIMTVDGMEINNGVYLYYQQSAYSDAQERIQAEYEEKLNNAVDSIGSSSDTSSDTSSAESSSSSGSILYFDQTIDGKSTSDWVKDETLRLVKEFVAVQRMCDEKGIVLDESETDELNETVKGVWDVSSYYYQYLYGFDTAGEYFETLGIGRESYKQIVMTEMLKSKLFDTIYGKDGEKPVPDEELNAYIKEKYAAAEMLELPYKNYKGEALTSDSDKKAVDDEAEKYAERLNNGESIVDVKYDFDLKTEQDSVRSQAESYYDDSPVEGKTRDEYVEEQVSDVSVDKAESDEDIITYINKENNSLDEDILEYILAAEDNGKATVFKTDESVFVIARLDITKRESWLDDNRNSALQSLKADDFTAFIDEYAANYEVTANSYLVDSKYRPEKLEVTA